MKADQKAYELQRAAAIIAFFDIFALGFMQAYLVLFLIDEFNIDLIQSTFLIGTVLLFKQLAYAVGAPIWGWLSDRVGCKKMLLRVMLGHMTAYFLIFLSRNVYEFMAFMCIDGALGSMTVPVFTMLANVTEPEDLPKVLSFNQSAQTIGGLLAPSIGSILAYSLGYRSTFLVVALVFACLVPLTLLMRFDQPPREAEAAEAPVKEKASDYLSLLGFDFVGLVLVSAALGFVNPITQLCLTAYGAEEGQLLFYSSILATLSSIFYAAVNVIGTRYVRRSLLPLLAFGGAAMAVIQSLFIDLRLFMVLQVGMRSVQAPVFSNLLGGRGEKRRTGVHMGILSTGRYVGSAIGPFIASTVATMVGLAPAFASVAAIQCGTFLLLFMQNRARKEKTA